MTLDDSYREMCLEVEALRASLERKVRHCDEITEERDQMQRERDEDRETANRLRMFYTGCELDRRRLANELAIAIAQRDEARAEVEMLRGVDCCANGDGPCGVCRKCAYRRGAEAMRLACQQWCRAWENNGEAIADALADLRVEDKP